MENETKKVFVVEPFTLRGKELQANNSLQEVPAEEVPGLLRKKLIALPDEFAPSAEPSTLERQLVSHLRPYSQGDETVLETLDRVLKEHTDSSSKLDDQSTIITQQATALNEAQTALQNEKATSADLRVQLDKAKSNTTAPGAPVSDGAAVAQQSSATPENEAPASPQSETGNQAPVEEPFGLEETEALSKATTSAVALTLVNAGFDTKKKLKDATDTDLLALDGVGEAMLTKIRTFAKA